MNEPEIELRGKIARAALGEEIQNYFYEHDNACEVLRGGRCGCRYLLVFVSRTKIAGIGPDLVVEVMSRH